MIMNFLMESCKPVIGQNNNEKQVHNARRTADELLGHQFPQEWRTNAISLSRFYALESLQGPYTSRFPLPNQDQGMNDVMNKSSWFWHCVPL